MKFTFEATDEYGRRVLLTLRRGSDNVMTYWGKKYVENDADRGEGKVREEDSKGSAGS